MVKNNYSKDFLNRNKNKSREKKKKRKETREKKSSACERVLEFETHDSKNPEGKRGERKKTQRKGNRDESWGSSRELNTSLSTLVSNDVDLAFSSRHCLVFHRWIHDEAKGGGREAESEAGFEWNSLMFSHRVEKKIDEIAIPMRFKWKTVYSYSADWAESIRRRIRAVPTAKRSLLPNTYVLRSSSLRILCPDSEDLSRSKRENSFTSHFFLSR